MGSIPSTRVIYTSGQYSMILSTCLNPAAVNRAYVNQTEPRASGLPGYPAPQLALPPPHDKIGQDRRLSGEWAFHLPSKLRNLWELLFGVIQSFRPKAFELAVEISLVGKSTDSHGRKKSYTE